MVELKGMTWNHPRGYDPMVATSRAYSEAHPEVRINWEQRSLQAFADYPLEELARQYDLIVIDHPHVGAVAGQGCLAPLDGVGRDRELALLAAQTVGQSHASYQYEGRQWALAIDAATQVAAYRPDLLSQPPTRWSEVVELGRQGRVLWPIKPVDALMCFYTLAANRGTPCAAREDLLIETADGLAVLEALHALAVNVPRECLEMNPIEVLERLSGNGNYAYCPLLYGYTNYSRDGFRPHLVRFADIAAIGDAGPRGSALGGTGIAVSANCQAPELAIDYAFWIAGAECQRGLYFESGGQPGNAQAWSDPRLNQASHDFFSATRATLEQAWLRPRYAAYLRFQEVGGDLVNAFLGGQATPAETMTRLQAAYLESRA